MEGPVRVGTVALCLVLVSLAGAQKLSLKERRTSVVDSLINHPGLKYLDLEFCGSGSESQISRGPLGCGFPVVGDHPWLVALGFKSGGQITFSCAGALISDQYVVTSARCAVGARNFTLAKVRVGEYDFGTTSDCLWYAPEQCLQAQDIGSGDVKVHDKFKPSLLGETRPNLYDIGLIRLEKPVVLGYGISPICLPIYTKRSPPRSQRAIGFSLASSAPMTPSGSSCCECDRTRGATSHVMDAVRLLHYNQTYDGPDPCLYKILGDQPGDQEKCIGAKDPCMSDKGGPLVSADRFGGAYFVLGVATKVPKEKTCQSRKDAAVWYTPVEPHTKWILDSMDEMAGGKPRPF